MKFSELVEKLAECAGTNSLMSLNTENLEITGVAPIDEAIAGTVSYIEGVKFASKLEKTSASAVILPMDDALQAQATRRGIAWIAGHNPRLLFAQTISLFYQPFQPAPEIHPTATIDPSCEIGSDIYIGANVVIQSGVKIGRGVCIYPNVVIYPDVEIGDNTLLHANCTIHERTRIGENCVIHSGAVIGAEGFGFVATPAGWFKMQQSGRTVLEDYVEIGCNSNVDRPAAGETRIGRNTKIDNLVQIGHGCQVGTNCVMAGQVGLAGNVKLGNNVILAGQVGVINQVKMGDGAIASSKSGVLNDVAAGEVVSGTPAVSHKLFLKVSAIYNRLPEIYQFIKQLQRRFKNDTNDS